MAPLQVLTNLSKYPQCGTLDQFAGLRAARKDFEAFPGEVQLEMMRALSVASEGEKADIAKPFKGVDGGVFEIAVKHRGDAFRSIYAVQIGDDVWVVDAFQKKSKRNQNAADGRKQN
jgi:phage-related protein